MNSGAILSFLSGWWNRLFSREEASRPRVPIIVAAATATKPAEPPGPTAAPDAGAPDRAKAQAEAAQSLAETIGVKSLPVRSAGELVIDPHARDRTLAALESLQQIPVLQSLATGLTQAMNQPEVAMAEVVNAISKDSALCVRVLRMANSAQVSPDQRIEDLETAVLMLGLKRVRQVAQALFTLRGANRVAEGFDWRHLWIHALATAAIAEELEAKLRPRSGSQVYLAALLHDVGKVVLSTVAPEEYREILVTTWSQGARLEVLERTRLGVDHREAGARFARRNGLSEMVLASIEHHDQPGAAKTCRFEVALAALANHLSKAHGLGFSGAPLDGTEGDFTELAAWQVIAEECAARPDPAELEAELGEFVRLLRMDLRELREAA